ncbi:recA-like protein [Croceicoccus sp. F390]|uniref:RecA-like protein n=1 Tax=Croceicoccus esteveae TaxID=3075597 RepID=A0ABU2ZJI6_9SPHN|nr:recA-like protein [Croceicoccus sp. F390]MDT0576763.1 recA-like protein [Croceicoccus sp. F390]
MDENRQSPDLSLVHDLPVHGLPVHDNGSAMRIEAGEAAPDMVFLPRPTTLVELFAGARDMSAIGFALAQVPRHGSVLWVQDRMSSLEAGYPHGRAITRFGGNPAQLIHVGARNCADALWTMEEGLRCRSLSCVIGEIWGDPRALDFTATKRLAMRAEQQGTPAFLIRFGAAANLSAARQRWRIASLPSVPHPYDDRAPGPPCWQAELFRARGLKPGTWMVHYDRTAHRLDFSAAIPDPAVVEAQRHRSSSGG